ncbi:MAG TPA: FAD-dependent oxidoreductase [Pyrinomonadaceae bacterium]|nr:FAD-dependent oxidoreductase [Pyrinomonadaceae bacterium]
MTYSRREILAAFLGLPVALAACRTSDTPPLPPGEIVGQSDVFGHRLRDGLRVEVPSDAWSNVPVVIVGAGVAGLTAAWHLQKSGFTDFALIELENAPGGTSRSGSSGSLAFPWGAHYIPAPMKENTALVSLLNEMGVIEGQDSAGEPVVAEQFLCRDPEERVFYKGRWYEGLYLHAGADAGDDQQMEKFNAEVNRWVVWRDAKGRRAFTLPVSACSDDAQVTALDRVSMGEWMNQRGLTSPRLRWWVNYACRDDYGMTLEQTSAWAGLFYFCARVLKPGVESQSLITWPEGNGRLVSHLYERSKANIQLDRAAVEINPLSDGIEIITLDRDGRTPRGYRTRFVIFAAPQFMARYVIRPYRENPPPHIAEFEFGSWMVANLTLKDRPKPGSPRDFPLAWDNVLYESESLGYVVATHQRGIDRGPTVFTYYYPLCDENPRTVRTRLLETDWRGWADVALTDLARAHSDIRNLVERLDVMRWGHAMIRPRTGFMWGQARRQGAKPFRSIHFAHSELSGVALFEEAFDNGLQAADEVLTQLRVNREAKYS